MPFVDDPSNADPHYDRTRFRALLRDTPWLDAAQVARSAAYVAEADATLREIEAKEELKKMITAPPAEENN